jgi:hypothetical protein
MEAAKRQREQAEGGTTTTATSAGEDGLSTEDIKLRNDRQRFQDLLENSMSGMDDDGMGLGHYLTVEQEEENADAVCEFFNVCVLRVLCLLCVCPIVTSKVNMNHLLCLAIGFAGI